MIHFQISKEQHQCLLGLTKYQPPSAVEEKLKQIGFYRNHYLILGRKIKYEGQPKSKKLPNIASPDIDP